MFPLAHESTISKNFPYPAAGIFSIVASSSWLQEIEGAVRAPTGDGGRVAASWILPAEWARLGVLERAEPIQRLEPSLPYQFALRAYVRRRLGSAAQSDEDLRAAIDSLSSTNLRFRSWHVRDVAQIPARYGNPDAVPEILAWIDRVGGRGAHFLTIVAPDLARMGFGRQIADRVARFLADPMLAFAALAAMRALGEGREGELSLGEPVQDGSLSLAGSGELSVPKRVRSGRKVTS